jgi:acetylornithine deacetylase/succinyl-diaminopimelate desuccinylase-like protein
MASAAVSYARENQKRFLEELKDLLRIPSVSTLPEHKDDVLKAAEFIANELKRIGMEHVEVIKTAGHPLVYADWLNAPGKPTILCYGHYDVQPSEPLDEWKSPPFEPTERDNNLYGRGTADDKGQMFMHIKAFESLMQTSGGTLPVNVRFLVEGEEETGGEAIEEFVNKHPERLKCDVALISDTEMFAPNLPSLCVGLRGMVYAEIEAVGAMTDLHSGMYGGAAPNPLEALSRIISKLKDEKGKILVPGIYKRVKKPSKDELKAWARLPFNEKKYLKNEVGSKELTGEKQFSVLYRTWARPTLEVHGMPGGFTGAGAKTVIPAKASAKVSMRLVPDQRPEEIWKAFSKYVKSLAPKGIKLEVKRLSVADASVIGTDNKYVRASAAAMKEIFKKDTVFIRSGGSVPIVAAFEKSLKAPSVMMGFGLPDDNIHAPNEKFHLPNFYRGIESLVRFFEIVGEGSVNGKNGRK